MVSVSLRQNRAGTPDQNSHSAAGPFDRTNPPRYVDGARGPGSPLVFVPGDGFYDWAGRRLFLADGSPEPDTPGAYRYQHNPDCTILDTSEADPSHPRYEPPYLRHQPGDTWEIGGKPYDPDDSGPYGTPRWRPDARTGRHRRNELPDPLPPELEAGPPEPEAAGGAGSAGTPAAPSASGESPQRPGPRPRSEPRPGPQTGSDRSRFWSEADNSASVGASVDARLREDAWGRFMTDSATLAAAHHRPQSGRSTLDRETGGAWALWIRLMQWLLATLKSLAVQPEAAEPAAAPSTEEACRPRPVRLPDRAVRSTAMARAVAGAQRARAGVVTWA